MASEVELRKIKKKYGERFMHMCRDLFPTILEQEGVLLSILENTFANNSRSLYDSIHDNNLEEEFKKFIYHKAKNEMEIKEDETIPSETPYELLDKAGYKLYECKSEADIQRFKKYYKNGETLCTFFGGRLNYCIVFFAVKKNVDEIKREDFKKPMREDEYGTSVMSIQFYKTGMCNVSIKNRYNHAVRNPDATYGNNLDKIIPGLAKSFENLLKERGLDFSESNIEKLEIPGYVVANDGKYYKYNVEVNGVYYCPGNIVIKFGEIIKVPSPEENILIENFVLDLKNKTIRQYDSIFARDGFLDGLKDIERVEILRDKVAKNGNRLIIIKRVGSNTKIKIKIDKDNQIVEYSNEEITEVQDHFLENNRMLSQLDLPNLRKVGNDFLRSNVGLGSIKLPNLVSAGDYFLCFNEWLNKLELPMLKDVGDSFLQNNLGLICLELPSLEEVNDLFLLCNKDIAKVDLPKLKKVGDLFLAGNKKLNQLNLPKLQFAGRRFLEENEILSELDLPELLEVENDFLRSNNGLKFLRLPKLQEAGGCFLAKNTILARAELPELKIVHIHFLRQNFGLESLELPKVEEIGSYFLDNNRKLFKLEAPNLRQVDDYFLHDNIGLVYLNLPNLESTGYGFLERNEKLEVFKAPKLKCISSSFLFHNAELVDLKLPSLEEVGSSFLFNNQKLRNFVAPNLRKVGNEFLCSNNSLVSIKVPKLKLVGAGFLLYINSLTPRKLSRLDRENNLTTSEFLQARIIITRLKVLSKNMFARENW